jgi:hypothetical protein
MVLDVAFIGGFIYIAQANRGGAGSCNGFVDTPFGSGDSKSMVHDDGHGGFTSLPKLHQACQLETACLAVSIVAIFFYIFSILIEVQLARHRSRAKRFGPSPANNYTSGYGKTGAKTGGLFGWMRRRTTRRQNDSELPEFTHPDQLGNTPGTVVDPTTRQSYATDATAVAHDGAQRPESKYANRYGEPGFSPHNHHDGTTGTYSGVDSGPYGQQQAGYRDMGAAPAVARPAGYNYQDGVYDRV